MKVILLTIFSFIGFCSGCSTEYLASEISTTICQLNILIDGSNHINDNIYFNIILFPLNCEYADRKEYIITSDAYIKVPEGKYNILIYGSEINNQTSECKTYYDSSTNFEVRHDKTSDNLLTFIPQIIEKQITFDWLYQKTERNKNIIVLSKTGILSENIIDIEVDVDEWEDNDDTNIEFN